MRYNKDDYCLKCKAELSCMAGCSAHPYNWYCPQCTRIEELQGQVDRVEKVELKLRLSSPENYYRGMRQEIAADIRAAIKGDG